MARDPVFIGTTYIYVPQSHPKQIDHTSTLHQQGTVAALVTLGYVLLNGQWYNPAYLDVIENGVSTRKLEAQRKARALEYDPVEDVEVREVKNT